MSCPYESPFHKDISNLLQLVGQVYAVLYETTYVYYFHMSRSSHNFVVSID